MGVFLGGKKSTKTDQKYKHFQQSSLAPTGCALGFHIYEFLPPQKPWVTFHRLFFFQFSERRFQLKSWVLKNHLVSIHEKKWWFGVTRLDATEPVSEFHPKTDTERCGGRWCVALDFMWTNQKHIAIQVLESHYFERKQFASQEKKGSPTNFLQSWFEHHPTEIDLCTPGRPSMLT